jgi:hypothetical protein
MAPLVAFDAIASVGTAIGELSATFGGVAPAVLTLAVAVYGLRFGWSLVKSFIH